MTDIDRDCEDATARLRRFVEEFDLTLPEMEYEDGDLVLTQDLMEWIADSGGSLDFMLLGDPWPMVRSYRARYASDRPLINTVRKLTEEEQRVFMGGLRAHAEGVPFEDAMAGIMAVVDELRSERPRAA